MACEGCGSTFTQSRTRKSSWKNEVLLDDRGLSRQLEREGSLTQRGQYVKRFDVMKYKTIMLHDLHTGECGRVSGDEATEWVGDISYNHLCASLKQLSPVLSTQRCC